MAAEAAKAATLRRGEGLGCAYIFGDPGGRVCGRPRQAGSSYCPGHHARCHLPVAAEAVRLRAVEALADAVGGRSGKTGTTPSTQFLDRLERLIRDFP